jgi:hypothetical protein
VHTQIPRHIAQWDSASQLHTQTSQPLRGPEAADVHVTRTMYLDGLAPATVSIKLLERSLRVTRRTDYPRPQGPDSTFALQQFFFSHFQLATNMFILASITLSC